MLKKLLSFIIACGVVTVIFGTIYTTVQQNYRQSANDPQIQMAEDASNNLALGVVPADIVSRTGHIDMSKSLAPFIMIFDTNGAVLESSAYLENSLPVPPKGVFDFAKNYGQNRLTWQPRSDVRIAAVVAPYSYQGSSGFVLAGRSLYEVEMREGRLTFMIFLGWLASIVGLSVLFLITWLL